jgi:hypothetical protein
MAKNSFITRFMQRRVRTTSFELTKDKIGNVVQAKPSTMSSGFTNSVSYGLAVYSRGLYSQLRLAFCTYVFTLWTN